MNDDDYKMARMEHALFLRRQGLTLKQVGVRLGLSKERARHLAVWMEWIEDGEIDSRFPEWLLRKLGTNREQTGA